MKIENGIMVMKDGKAWGCVGEDGPHSEYGWVDPENALMFKPEFCRNQKDVPCRDSYGREELRTAKFVHVQRRTEVIASGGVDDNEVRS